MIWQFQPRACSGQFCKCHDEFYIFLHVCGNICGIYPYVLMEVWECRGQRRISDVLFYHSVSYSLQTKFCTEPVTSLVAIKPQ